MGSAPSNQGNTPRDVGPACTEPVLHVWPAGASSRAIIMVAKAASIDLQTKVIDVLQNRKTDSRDKINPDKGLPLLMRGKKSIKDSHEIMRFLLREYANKPRVYPEDLDKRNKVEKMLTYDKAKVFPAVTQWLYPQVFQDIPPNADKEKAIHACLDHIEDVLKDQPCVALQQVTVADLFIVASLTLLEVIDYDFDRWTRVKLWIQQTKDLPYYASSNQGLNEWKLSLNSRTVKL